MVFFFPHLHVSKPDLAGFKPLPDAPALDNAETQPMVDESQIAAAAAAAFSLAMPTTSSVPSHEPLKHENPPGLEVRVRLVLLSTMGQVAYWFRKNICKLVTLPILDLKLIHLICTSSDTGPHELST